MSATEKPAFMAVVRTGRGMGTHPDPVIVVFARTLFGLEDQIWSLQMTMVDIVFTSRMQHWHDMVRAAQIHGEAPPNAPQVPVAQDFPVLWQSAIKDIDVNAGYPTIRLALRDQGLL